MFQVGELVRYSPELFRRNKKCGSEVFEIKEILKDGSYHEYATVELVCRLPGCKDAFKVLNIGHWAHIFITDMVKIDLNLKYYWKLRHWWEIRNLSLL